MESDHGEAASTGAKAAPSGNLDHFGLFHGGMSTKEHNDLVVSVLPLRGSVGRIILANKNRKEVIQTGTASLVYKGDERSLFVTCSHNFGEKMGGEVIRLLDVDKETVRDYPIEKIIYRHEDHDFLFFSVKDLLPQHKCLQFSTNQVNEGDRVAILGFAGASLPVNRGEFVDPAPILVHSVLSGVVSCDPYGNRIDGHHEKMYHNCCSIKGHSGSPVFKNGKVVAVNRASDRTWRDGVPTNTILHYLKEHLEVGTDNATIDDLLEGLHKKSGHVPHAEHQPVNKKSKRKARG